MLASAAMSDRGDTVAAATTTTGRTDPVLHFPLQEGEQVLTICRRHWLYLWPRTAVMALFALVPVIVAGVALSWADVYGGRTAQVYWIASAVWVGYWAIRMFLNWYRYNNDIWVITNQRIVDSYKSNPLSLKMSTAD